jgi:hypothetical protein
MALKNKRKWIFLSILIVALSIGITFALIRPNFEGGIDSTASPANFPSNPGDGSGFGNGILYVYINSERTREAPTNSAGNYLVLFSALYYLKVVGITEYAVGETINIWYHYEIDDITYNIPLGSFVVGDGGTIEFEWTAPTDIPYETAIKFKYGTSLTGPNWYFAKKAMEGVRLSLVIPEFTLGSLGAITALFFGLGIALIRRKGASLMPRNL